MDDPRHEVLVAADHAPSTRPDDTGLLAERLLDVLSASMREVRHEMRRHSGLELTVPQFRALRFVQRHPGCDLSSLATHLGMSASSASALVDRLQRAGHVERSTDPNIRRRIRIHLSPAGAEALERAVAGTRTWLSRQLETFDSDERRRLGAALSLLARIGTAGDADRGRRP